jgi:hypothetical protein
MKKKPLDKDRSFGISVGGVLLLVTAFLVWRGRMTAAQITGSIGAVLLALGFLQPRLLKWPSAVWWRMAMILGHVNARVILTLAFSLVLSPLGLLWRLIGKDPLTRQRRQWPGWSRYPDRYKSPDHFTRMY